MKSSWLKEQLDAVGRKMEEWPEWERKQLDAEIQRTPLKSEKTDPKPDCDSATPS